MGRISIPPGAGAVFRVTIMPSFEAALRIEMWGANKRGWFSARCRGLPPRPDLLIPHQQLRRGQWRSLINHVHQSRFWGLPEFQPETGFVVFDGSDTTLEGQQGESYHRVLRHEQLEPGLARTVNFMLHTSTLLERLPDRVAACYLQDVSQPPI